MRRIILISFLFVSFLAKAQQYTNFQGYGFKANRLWADSVSIQPSDTVKNKVAKSIAILNNKLYVADGTKWIIAGGGAVDTFFLSTRAWRQKGIDSVVGLLNNISVDSFIYSTRAWRQKGIDSVQANLNSGLSAKLNISDTALMLIPYLRKADTITLSNRIDARVKYTDTASMLSPYSKLKSVGLTMPSAFNVANSPLTSDGTIAVSGAGTAAQYVRGDGQLANFPSNGGGGSSVNYYLNGSVNQGTFGGDTYYELSKIPIIGAGTNFTRTNAQGDGYIASFITDAGDPALLNIPGGNWNLEFYFNASSGGSTPSFYAEIYKVSSSNVFTLIASGSTNPEGITQGTVVDQYFTSIPVPQTTILATDRIAIRIFVTTSGRTIILHTENSNLCEVLTTFSTGLNALNGLTNQVQYFATGTSGTDFNISSATDTHTFNLPTASATNRGALSTTDWTTFNGKIGAGDTATMLNPYTRGSGTSGQIGYWNATRSLTGSSGFTFTPTSSLLVNNSVTAASAIARGANLTPTLVAAANNDVLVGLDINPTFTNGAFTGLTNTGLRVQSGGIIIGSTTTSLNPFLQINSSTRADIILRTSGSINNSFTVYALGGAFGSNYAQFGTNDGENSGSQGGAIYTDSRTGVAPPIRLMVKGTGTTTMTNAMSVFNTANIAINTSTDAGFRLDVNGTARFNVGGGETKLQTNTQNFVSHNRTSSSGVLGFDIRTSGNQNSFWTYDNGTGDVNFGQTAIGAGALKLFTANTERMRIFYNGNIGMNTTTDAGFRLDVNGTARVQGTTTITGSTTATGAIARGANLTPTLTAAANNDVLVGLDINPTFTNGAFTDTRNLGLRIFGSSSGNSPSFEIRQTLNTAPTWLTIRNSGDYNAIGTVAADLGISGGANQFFTGTVAGDIAFKAYSQANTSKFFIGATSGNNANLTLFTNGNVGIRQTTDAGFRLDVNGTARVQGALTSTGAFPSFTASSTSASANAGYQSIINNGTGNSASFLAYGNAVAFGLGNNAGFGSSSSIVIFGNSATSTGGTTTIKLRPGGFETSSDALVAYQNSVSIGTTNIPNSSAVLDVESTTKGFLPPRMTTAQRDLISSPATGLTVFDITVNKVSVYNGTAWKYLLYE